MKKDKTILLRVSADEKRKLSYLAKKNRMAVSKFMLTMSFAGQSTNASQTTLSNATIREILWRRGDYNGFF